jgi:hypothetical protein
MRKSHLITAGLFILFIVLIARLIWTASHTETGWTVLKRQWLDATVGEVVKDYSPISRWKPNDQADFWLKEVKRITSADPDNAELAMGAASILDYPTLDEMYFYWSAFISITTGKNLPDNQVKNRFEEKCVAECLAMAARATDLQPNDVRWWRLRAGLLFYPANNPSNPKLRDSSWIEILDQCNKHDPDNAFYDYLAANYLWNTSGEFQYITGENTDATKNGKKVFKITDTRKYDQAFEFIQNGQKKKYLRFGGDKLLVLNSFLKRSLIPRRDFADIVIIRQNYNKRVYWLLYLWYDMFKQVELAQQKDDATESLHITRLQVRRTLEQLRESDGAPSNIDVNLLLHLFYVNISNRLRSMAEDNPDLIPGDEIAKIESDYEEASNEEKFIMAAYARLLADSQNPSSIYVKLFLHSWLVQIAQYLALLLFVTGLSFCLTSICLGRIAEKPAAVLGPIRHAIAWLAGGILPLLALVLMREEFMSSDMQKSIGAWSLILYVGLVVNLLFWRFIYRRKFPYCIKVGIVSPLVIAVFIGLFALIDLEFDDIGILRAIITIPLDVWHGIDSQHIRNILASQMGCWYYILCSWYCHAGLYFSIAYAFVLLIGWYQLRYPRKTAAPSRRWKSRLVGMFDELARSTIAVAIIWLFIYLLFAPPLLRTYEDRCHTAMSFVSNPNKYDEMLEKSMTEVKQDWKWMNDPQIQNQQDSSD